MELTTGQIWLLIGASFLFGSLGVALAIGWVAKKAKAVWDLEADPLRADPMSRRGAATQKSSKKNFAATPIDVEVSYAHDGEAQFRVHVGTEGEARWNGGKTKAGDGVILNYANLDEAVRDLHTSQAYGRKTQDGRFSEDELLSASAALGAAIASSEAKLKTGYIKHKPRNGKPESWGMTTISAVQREDIITAIRILAREDVGTRSQDGIGFNKDHSEIGKELAAQNELSEDQAGVGRDLLRYYKKQLLTVDMDLYHRAVAGIPKGFIDHSAEALRRRLEGNLGRGVEMPPLERTESNGVHRGRRTRLPHGSSLKHQTHLRLC